MFRLKNLIGYVLVAFIVLLAFNQSASASSSTITFQGKGNGHGVGMSQWGAKGMADKKYTYDKILSFYYTGVKLETKNTSSQKIRVLLGKSIASASVSATTNYIIKDSKGKTIVSLKSGQIAKVSYSKGYYSVYSVIHKKTFKTKYPLYVVPTKAGAVRYKNLKYDGQLFLYQNKGMNIVNHVPLESYVAGVLPYEMYATWPTEALKAQSVAARTYSIKRLGAKGYWDVDDTINYQVYRGKNEHEKRMKELTNSTKGKVLTYQGKYIDALFYSSSGGHTLSAQYWGNHVPYLIGKKDPYDRSEYVTKGWTYSISKKDLGSRYGIGTVKSIQVLKTAENRPVTLKINGTSKSIVVSAHSLRTKLGGLKVKSTYFSIKQ